MARIWCATLVFWASTKWRGGTGRRVAPRRPGPRKPRVPRSGTPRMSARRVRWRCALWAPTRRSPPGWAHERRREPGDDPGPDAPAQAGAHCRGAAVAAAGRQQAGGLLRGVAPGPAGPGAERQTGSSCGDEDDDGALPVPEEPGELRLQVSALHRAEGDP